jgi:hypothetical protein
LLHAPRRVVLTFYTEQDGKTFKTRRERGIKPARNATERGRIAR